MTCAALMSPAACAADAFEGVRVLLILAAVLVVWGIVFWRVLK